VFSFCTKYAHSVCISWMTADTAFMSYTNTNLQHRSVYGTMMAPFRPKRTASRRVKTQFAEERRKMMVTRGEERGRAGVTGIYIFPVNFNNNEDGVWKCLAKAAKLQY
jgi:hypothetical protein